MLKELSIKDFALIEQLSVSFTAGLNVLTGETGAGKSIIIDALNAVLGGKVGPSLIRASQDKAVIEAIFEPNSEIIAWLKTNDLLDEELDGLVLSREITGAGSRARVNGTLVNVSLLSELRQKLLTIHAQHEAKTLLSRESQLSMLDALGDDDHGKLLEKVKTLYLKIRELESSLSGFDLSEDERLQKIGFAQFQLTEISEANIANACEDEDLSQRLALIANAADLQRSSQKAYEFLSGGQGQENVIDLLNASLYELEKASRAIVPLATELESLRGALSVVEDSARQIRHYHDSLDLDAESLAEMEARLSMLNKLKRKYGLSLSEIVERQEKLVRDVGELENARERQEEISKELVLLEKEYFSWAKRLSKARQEQAAKFSRQIGKSLYELGMPHCRFEVHFSELSQEDGESRKIAGSGIDRAEFMLAPNPGVPMAPVSKIASGGELSRVMLAIKAILARADATSSVVFDEIDTGLSGKALQSVRDQLAKLATSHQILCITHQPIIASVAENHLLVEKVQTAKKTVVSVEKLDKKSRVKALAAMAAGNHGEAFAIKFAQGLLDEAAQLRQIYRL